MSETLEKAYLKLDEGREGRPDPITAGSHTDHWLLETRGNILADVARGNVELAEDQTTLWFDAQADNGRFPHMIINTDDTRRRFVDGPIVQQASWQHKGHMITPLAGVPLMAGNVEVIAGAKAGASGNEADELLARALPSLERENRWRYAARDIYNDGLPVLIAPDEAVFRHSPLVAQVLKDLPDNWLRKLEAVAQGSGSVQDRISAYRRWQGDDQKELASSTYDPSQFMRLDTAAAAYSAFGVALRNRYSARRIAADTTKDGQTTGFLIQDVATNALLIDENIKLLRIYERLGKEVPSDIMENTQRTRENFGLHWDEQSESFKARNPRTGELYEDTGSPESLLATYALPVLSGLQYQAVVRKLEAHLQKGMYSLVSAVGDGFDPNYINRGAVDPMLNMFVAESLRGHEQLCAQRQRIVSHMGQLASEHGFARGYNAETGKAIGQQWTPAAAAVVAVDAK